MYCQSGFTLSMLKIQYGRIDELIQIEVSTVCILEKSVAENVEVENDIEKHFSFAARSEKTLVTALESSVSIWTHVLCSKICKYLFSKTSYIPTDNRNAFDPPTLSNKIFYRLIPITGEFKMFLPSRTAIDYR